MSDGDRARLEALLEEFLPEVAAVARGALARLEQRFPGAPVLVYDAFNALAIGLTVDGTRRGLFLHLPVYPRWVNLGFNGGAGMDDPEGLLVGSGSSIRHIRLNAGDDLGRPAVAALLDQAAERAGFTPGGPGGVKLMPWNGKKRPRRP